MPRPWEALGYYLVSSEASCMRGPSEALGGLRLLRVLGGLCMPRPSEAFGGLRLLPSVL